MRTKTAVLLLALCAFVSSADAAVVTLKDGSRLRGAVTGQGPDGIELRTPDGTLHVAQSRILAIDYSDESPAESPQAVSQRIGFDVPTNNIDFHSIPGGGQASNGDLGIQFGAQYFYYLTSRLAAGV